MDIQLAMLVLNGISALSSSIQLYKQCINEDTVEQFDELLSKRLIRQASEDDAKLFSNIISNDILEGVLNNIEDRKERLNNSIRDREKSHADRLRDADEISRDICFELNYIKKFNQGTLPNIKSVDLYKLWLEHGCK